MLAVDIEMNPVDGYAISSWDRGYGDFALTPDLSTLRRIPWLPGTALVLADVRWPTGEPVVESPRRILQDQTARLAERGWQAMLGNELEFLLFVDSYRVGRSQRYRRLQPANQYNVDYSILGQLPRRAADSARSGWACATPACAWNRRRVECNPGQYEIALKYDEAMRTCDNHVIYKNGAKRDRGSARICGDVHGQVRPAGGRAPATFTCLCVRRMASPSSLGERPYADSRRYSSISWLGSSRHSLNSRYSLRRASTRTSAANPDPSHRPRSKWGIDNRTCAFRVVGHGPSLRVECRIPGADVNPYLAAAAMSRRRSTRRGQPATS